MADKGRTRAIVGFSARSNVLKLLHFEQVITSADNFIDDI